MESRITNPPRSDPSRLEWFDDQVCGPQSLEKQLGMSSEIQNHVGSVCTLMVLLVRLGLQTFFHFSLLSFIFPDDERDSHEEQEWGHLTLLVYYSKRRKRNQPLTPALEPKTPFLA